MTQTETSQVPHICIFSSLHQALDPRVFYREAVSLRRAGCRVTLIAVHPRRETLQGIEILPLPRLPRWKRPLLWLRLLRLALAARADAYHFHAPELLFVAPWLRLLSGKPVVYDVHEAVADFIDIKYDLPTPLRLGLAAFFRRLEPALAARQSGLIFADDQIAAAFRKVKRPKTTLFNYPDEDFLRQAEWAAGSKPPPGPVILYLGGINPSRGPALMIEAFQRVVEQLPQARLLLVGPFAPASLEARARRHVQDLGLGEQVTITGSVPFATLGPYLEQAAVGWIAFDDVPKYQKNIPTKLFEYWAYRIPVVSSDLRPIRPYLVQGETGLFAAPGDPAAHAAALLELLQDPERAAAMGARGQAAVLEKYNWMEMEARLLHFYAQILGRPLPPA
jgi:glycosyltransferase involved in cell wall biosynthesis